jgi:hypothetical protein
MPIPQPSRDEMEATMRRLLSEHDLPEPDEIRPHEDGGILCLWHEQKVAVIVDPDEAPALGPAEDPALGPADGAAPGP